MSNEKYKMFSNYMHNELGITKEDIRTWVKEAVNEVATKMCQKEFDDFDPNRVVKRVIFDDNLFGSITLKKQVSEEFARQLASRITLTLKD